VAYDLITSIKVENDDFGLQTVRIHAEKREKPLIFTTHHNVSQLNIEIPAGAEMPDRDYSIINNSSRMRMDSLNALELKEGMIHDRCIETLTARLNRKPDAPHFLLGGNVELSLDKKIINTTYDKDDYGVERLVIFFEYCCYVMFSGKIIDAPLHYFCK